MHTGQILQEYSPYDCYGLRSAYSKYLNKAQRSSHVCTNRRYIEAIHANHFTNKVKSDWYKVYILNELQKNMTWTLKAKQLWYNTTKRCQFNHYGNIKYIILRVCFRVSNIQMRKHRLDWLNLHARTNLVWLMYFRSETQSWNTFLRIFTHFSDKDILVLC